jgi:hypothetical protein
VQNQIRLIVLSCVTLSAALNASANVIDGPITNPSNGNSYYLLSSDNWTNSEIEAESMGGTLATIADAADDSWITSTFGDYSGVERCLWIGFYDPSEDQYDGNHASNFLWVSGATTTYTNWYAGSNEPNNADGQEWYTEMYPAQIAGQPMPAGSPGTWNDAPDVSNPYAGTLPGVEWGPVFGVVEVQSVPEPGSLSILIAGTLISLKHRKRRPPLGKSKTPVPLRSALGPTRNPGAIARP